MPISCDLARLDQEHSQALDKHHCLDEISCRGVGTIEPRKAIAHASTQANREQKQHTEDRAERQNLLDKVIHRPM
ncbi:hypothetical protein FRC0552_01995 [Corynebacterium diphtheriae]|nr:hypothetical protein FRC0552_01995 [Corynebacterium diphtheriae]